MSNNAFAFDQFGSASVCNYTEKNDRASGSFHFSSSGNGVNTAMIPFASNRTINSSSSSGMIPAGFGFHFSFGIPFSASSSSSASTNLLFRSEKDAMDYMRSMLDTHTKSYIEREVQKEIQHNMKDKIDQFERAHLIKFSEQDLLQLESRFTCPISKDYFSIPVYLQGTCFEAEYLLKSFIHRIDSPISRYALKIRNPVNQQHVQLSSISDAREKWEELEITLTHMKEIANLKLKLSPKNDEAAKEIVDFKSCKQNENDSEELISFEEFARREKLNNPELDESKEQQLHCNRGGSLTEYLRSHKCTNSNSVHI